MSLSKLKILEAHKGLKNKDFTCEELVGSYIKEAQDKDEEINAYVLQNFEIAMNEAGKVDEKINKGKEIKILEGMPVSIKDCFCVKGMESTASSNILKGYIPPYDATVVKKILDQGSIILGKVNTDEFTMGASTETSAFGVTKNPYDLERVAGGSSGGSAASVAANMAMYSLATDTGGSIRQPATFCGVPGLKVTYGRVSRYGAMSMASSLDTIGPIAKSVEDLAIILENIAGHDKKDSTTPKVEVPRYIKELDKDIKGLKVGVPKEYFIEGLNKDVLKSVESAIKKLRDLGVEILDISLPHTEHAIATYYIIAPSEISSNMARYDGIRYGFSVARNKDEDVKNLMDIYKKSKSKGFGPEVKRRIMLGTYALSAGYYDAYYKKAMKVRTLIKQDFDKAFENVDAIIAPVTPGPAFKIGENVNNPLQMYLEDIFTAPVNLAGVPSLSVPFGKSKDLPLGVQIIGRHFDEKTILQIGNKLEK
jgi:aspartyl-tRNA(Asn)/glutamyl-tRNA(Gln) amidotransferase subunit A